ncbi:MAG TPA: DUF3426 domain-containing protein [Methanobacterium subterraneum]|uniref:DUF3426 domain-containing protein n=1 Tax=Methanobacterium subterraneum TaxID=59277 RepID=A0A7J4TJL2_9EURY|nr:DUF3426 domain-containing protein [Methanobacterium subterraneum]
MTKICPNCNKVNADSAGFCQNCGEELGKSEPLPPTTKSSGGASAWWGKQSSNAKAAIIIAGICCIGLIAVVGLVGMYSPDKTTSTSTSSVSTSTQPTGNITVLSSSPRRDGIGNYIVSGEVQNNYNTPKKYVQISGTGYDSTGKVVATHTTYASLDSIPAGGTSPFTLYLDDENDQITTYKLQAEA